MSAVRDDTRRFCLQDAAYLRARAAMNDVFGSADLAPLIFQLRWTDDAGDAAKPAASLKSEIRRLVRSMAVDRRFAAYARYALVQLENGLILELMRHELAALKHLQRRRNVDDATFMAEKYRRSNLKPDDRMEPWHLDPEFVRNGGPFFVELFGVPFHHEGAGSQGALEQKLAILRPQTIAEVWRVLQKRSLCGACPLAPTCRCVLGVWYEHPYEWLNGRGDRPEVTGVHYMPSGAWLPYTHEDHIVQICFERRRDASAGTTKALQDPECIYAVRPQVDDFPHQSEWYAIDLLCYLRHRDYEDFQRRVKALFQRRDAAIVRFRGGGDRKRVIPSRERFVVKVPVEPFALPMKNKKGDAPLLDASLSEMLHLRVETTRVYAARGRGLRTDAAIAVNTESSRDLSNHDMYPPQP